MDINKRQTVAFTTKYPCVVRALSTEITVTSTFDRTKSIKLQGIWDTGATHSSINKKYIETLDLKTVGMCVVNTAGGSVDATQHIVDMILPNGQTLTMHVTATDLVNTDMLIGMDIISQGDFAVSNFNGKTILNFRLPSVSDTDFVQNLKSMQPIKSGYKQGRNDPCHCGSGKKYKNCCGKFTKQF